MKRFRFLGLPVWYLALAASPAPADVKPIGLFGDNVVLQREMKTPVWGTADSGEKVAVTVGKYRAEANYPDIRQFRATRYVAADQPQSTVEGTWVACSPQRAAGLSAVCYFFARDIQKALNVPIGLIVTGDVAETLVPVEVLQRDPDLHPILNRWAAELAKWPERKPVYDAQVKEWQEAVKKAKAEGRRPPAEPNPPPNPNYWRRPGGLYNGTIAAMIPYGIRGVITYVERPLVYESRKLLPAVVNCWRSKWGQGDFPFLMAQVANYRHANPQPGESTLAEFREAQLLTALTVPNTALVATIDIGDAIDIHPRNEQDVGKRLALAARALAYGEKVVYSGPVYDSMVVESNHIRLRFKHVGGGLIAKGGDPLKQFTVAGKDKEFVWADAKVDGDTVLVASDKVSLPVAVRYAWADNPEGCNLYNRESLPAVPFRTDDWPISGSPRTK
ncbi:MAG: sialate O-acetylesterase [Thermoguttaceae bacterium]|jgi:sialate O-acetylesterase